jgi:hypothetical protein
VKRPLFFAAAALLAAFVPATAARAQYTFTGFGPAQWGAADATLGVAGLTVENFEDVNLAPGLQVGATSSLGTYGPTSVLPQTFNPSTQDGFGSAFVGGNWDGANVLVNTGTNRPGNYGIAAVWGSVTFTFAGAGTDTLGFSLQQAQAQVGVSINGVSVGSLQSLAGLSTSSGRVGYIRIDATGSAAPIQTLTLTNNASGDGWVVDHLAFRAGTAAVPEPGTLALSLAAFGAVGVFARRRVGRAGGRA